MSHNTILTYFFYIKRLYNYTVRVCFFVAPCETAKEAASLIESLVVAPHAFTYRGTEHSFRISIGYAECPADARDESRGT